MPKLLAFSYCLVISVASLLPSAGESDGIDWQAGIPATIRHAHLPAYAVLVILMLTAYAWSAERRGLAILGIGAICFGFGLLLEIVQGVAIPGRSAGLSDLAANAAGIVVGTGVWIAGRAVVGARREASVERYDGETVRL